MNAEQLNGILTRLAGSHRALQTPEKLATFRAALEAMANNPTDGNLQTQFATTQEALVTALQSPALNHFTVREAKLIDDLDLDLLVGIRMQSAIREALTGSAITPRIAFDAVVKIHDQATKDLKKILSVSTGLSNLGIEPGGPAQNEVELGLYIPRSGGDLNLEDLVEQGEQLNDLLKLSNEVVFGTAVSPDVTYLTSSDYGFLLKVAPAVVKFLLDLIESVFKIRRQFAEDRELYKRLREVGHDEEAVHALENAQSQKREAEIDQVVRLAINQQNGIDEHRKNEIAIPLTKGIRILVEQSERGTYIDVRVGEIDDPSEENNESQELQALEKKAALLREIEAASHRIHALEQRQSAPPSLPAPGGPAA